jgi:protein arginine kinase activator
MNCEICKKNPATVFLTQMMRDEKRKVNLCDSCAKEKGLVQVQDIGNTAGSRDG